MNPLLMGIQQQQNNNEGLTVQEVFRQMMTGQINPKEFMLSKINALSPQEKTRLKTMMNNGMLRSLFKPFGISDNQYMDFVKSINL